MVTENLKSEGGGMESEMEIAVLLVAKALESCANENAGNTLEK
ncbi:MAG: hypothetical protein WCI76_02295 [bacterium]